MSKPFHKVSSLLQILFTPTYHHPCGHRYASATVGVRYNVSISNTEEGDCYQPHGVQKVGVLLVMVPWKLK